MRVVVRRYNYIDILRVIIHFPYSTCISSFFIPTSLFIFKMFLFGLVSVIFLHYNYSKRYS